MKDLLNFKKIPTSYIVVAIVLIIALSVGLTINRVNNVTKNNKEAPPPSDVVNMSATSRGELTVEEFNDIRGRFDVSVVITDVNPTQINDRHAKQLLEILLQDKIRVDLEINEFIQNSLVVVKTGDEPMFEESTTTVSTIVTGDGVEKFTDEQILLIVGIIQDNITGIKLQNIQIVDDEFNIYDVDAITNKIP